MCPGGVVGKRVTGSDLPFCRGTLTTGQNIDEGGAVTRLALDTVRIIQARRLVLVKGEKLVDSRNAEEVHSVGIGCWLGAGAGGGGGRKWLPVFRCVCLGG